MNQIKSEKNSNGNDLPLFYYDRASNFAKGLGAFFAVVLTYISFVIIAFIIISDNSFEIQYLLPYLYGSILLLFLYSVITTRTANVSIAFKLSQSVKRFLDVVTTALMATFIFVPLFPILTIAIRVESPGPVLFRSRRVGQFGKLFDAYKFRTMYAAPTEKPITRVGNFLRRTYLNQMPMLINVLTGELSLVGPWPRLPEDIEETLDKNKKILSVRPGITGIWQLSNFLSSEHIIELDLNYIDHWSLWLDLKILIKTVFVAFFK